MGKPDSWGPLPPDINCSCGESVNPIGSLSAMSKKNKKVLSSRMALRGDLVYDLKKSMGTVNGGGYCNGCLSRESQSDPFTWYNCGYSSYFSPVEGIGKLKLRV